MGRQALQRSLHIGCSLVKAFLASTPTDQSNRRRAIWGPLQPGQAPPCLPPSPSPLPPSSPSPRPRPPHPPRPRLSPSPPRAYLSSTATMAFSRSSSTSDPALPEKIGGGKRDDAVVHTGFEGRVDEEHQGEEVVDGVFGEQGKGTVDYRRCAQLSLGVSCRRDEPLTSSLSSSPPSPPAPSPAPLLASSLASNSTASDGSRPRSSS